MYVPNEYPVPYGRDDAKEANAFLDPKVAPSWASRAPKVNGSSKA